MAKQSWSPGAVMAPIPPALVSCGSLECPGLLTVGWTGIVNTRPPKTYISVRPERYSYPMLQASREFVINLPSASLVRAVDLCGVRSGREIDKLAATGLHLEPATVVSAPMVAECPISIECRVTDVLPLGSHDMFLADIVRVNVDERCLDPKGALDMARCDLLAYAHGSYFALGQKLGTFGYSVRKKPAPGRKPPRTPARKGTGARRTANRPGKPGKKR